METIPQLKKALYLALLQKPNEEWTDSEVDIAFALSKDRDIQEVLEAKMKETV